MYFKIQGTYFKIYALYFSRKITSDFQLLTKALNSAFFLCEIRHLRSRECTAFPRLYGSGISGMPHFIQYIYGFIQQTPKSFAYKNPRHNFAQNKTK